MANLGRFLAQELGIVLVGEDPFERADDLATLDRVDRRAFALALEKGAASKTDIAYACIACATSALDLANECDLDEDVHLLLARLGHEVRFQPSWIPTLLEIGDEEALETLEILMRHASEAARRKFAPDVIAALDGPHAASAVSVIWQMAQASSDAHTMLEDAVPKLIALLPSIPEHATNALRALGDPRAIDPLFAMLVDPEIEARFKAWNLASALGDLGATKAAPSMVELLAGTTDKHERSFYVAALAKLDPVLAAPTVAKVWDPSEVNMHAIRIAEAGALAGCVEAIAFLERAAESMGHLRGNALTSLAKVKGAGAFEMLRKSAESDADDFARAHAVAALRALRDPRAFDALVAALRANQSNAATALYELGDPRAIPVLVERLGTEHGYRQLDVMIKEATIGALGDFGVDRDDVWRALVARLLDRSDHVTECAAIACQQLRPGCTEGVSKIVQKMDRIPNVPALVERNTVPMLDRLDRATEKGPPRNREAALEILEAMKRLHARIRPPTRDRLMLSIDRWRAWAG